MKKITLFFSLFGLVVLGFNPVQAQSTDEDVEDLILVPDLEEEDDAVLLATIDDQPEKKAKKNKKNKTKKVKAKMKNKNKKKGKAKKEDDMES